MGDLLEVLLTTDSTGAQSTCTAWDLHTGTTLMTYKGGSASNYHGLSVIKNKFIVTTNITKPLMHIWPINKQEQFPGIHLVTPGKVNALAISPEGNYITAGIQESIYIWQVCSGKLLSVLSKHYQNITTLKFTDDGSHFISGSQDGSVLVWNLCRMILQGENYQPIYSLNDHALAVTDIFVGNGGMYSFMCSISLDRTCRVYDLASCSLLLNLVFWDTLHSIIMDALETYIFVGSSEGPIYEVKMHSPPRTKEYHLTKESLLHKFVGHKGMVTALSLSFDGTRLVSGGNDNNVCIWHTKSKQLLRVLQHKGTITNLFLTITSRGAFSSEVQLNLVITNLKRMIDTSADDTSVTEVLMTESIEYKLGRNEYSAIELKSASPTQELEKLRNEVQRLKKVNKELFEYAIQNILNK